MVMFFLSNMMWLVRKVLQITRLCIRINIVGQTELCADWSIRLVIVKLHVDLMINMIIIVIVVSDDILVVWFVVDWVVVVSLGLQGCCGGDKTCF